MADYLINIFLDETKMKTIEGAGLAGHVKEIDGKKAIQVPVNEKEQKKLVKGFPDLKFDAGNACVLPPEAENKLVDIIGQMKVLDVMKVAIMKLYSPVGPARRYVRPSGNRFSIPAKNKRLTRQRVERLFLILDLVKTFKSFDILSFSI